MSRKKYYHDCLTTPFETSIRNFTAVAKFFMYYAPGIDSQQISGGFQENISEVIFTQMLCHAGMRRGKNAIIQKQIRNVSWQKVELEDDYLDFECTRFLCDKYGSETDLHALLRHIRNSLAHGCVYVWKKAITCS